MQESELETYKPGRCNIGPVEIRRRYRIGYTGLILMIAFIIFAEYFRIPRLWKLLLFLPVYYSLSGFIQARMKFCYVYGYIGVFSLEGRKTFSRVRDEESMKRDRRTVFQILTWIITGSGILTALYYFLSQMNLR